MPSAQSRRARRTGSGCRTDSFIRSLRQRIRWHSSMMILIATRGSRSRRLRKSSPRNGPEGKAGFHSFGPV